MWLPAFGVVISSQWQYSPPIVGELFRFSYLNVAESYARVLICQSDTMEPSTHFGAMRIYPGAESDIHRFVAPECFGSRSIGVKSLYEPINQLTLFADIWLNPMALANPSAPNYPVSTTAASTTVGSSVASVAILAANTARKGATIWNASTATLYLDLDAAATVADYAARLDPSGYYEVPFGFTGAISGIWSAANGSALVREFT